MSKRKPEETLKVTETAKNMKLYQLFVCLNSKEETFSRKYIFLQKKDQIVLFSLFPRLRRYDH